MISTASEHFDEIIADLKYAKEFKTPYVLFTTNGQCIGYGESFSYMKTEIQLMKECYLRGVILETKKFARIIKAIEENPQRFDFTQIPLKWTTPLEGIDITLGLSPNYVEYNAICMMKEVDSLKQETRYVIDKTDEFMENYKNLKADDGVVNLTIEDRWFIPLHKKIVPIVSTDKVEVEIRSNDTIPYFYALVYVTSKKGFIYCIYIKLLKV
jgi:hypothetical protein